MENRSIKKILIYSCVYLALVIGMIYMSSATIHSIEFQQEYNGIQFRYSQTESSEKMYVALKGYLSKPIIGRHKFKGEMVMNQTTYKLDFEVRPFDLVYLYDENGSNIGQFIGDDHLKNVTILLEEKVIGAKMVTDEKTGKTSLEVVEPIDKAEEYGQLIFSGPATRVEEAIFITEANLSKHKQGYK